MHDRSAASPLAAARERCRRAYHAARKADVPIAGLIDRWWAETLMMVDDQPAGRATVMLVRTAIMLEVVADRAGWPDRMR
jgi:hypothetical protein